MNKPIQYLRALGLAGLLFLGSCAEEEKAAELAETAAPTLFTLMPPDSTGVDFVNAVENQKNFNIFKYRNFYNGGGVAIGDINNDGLPDLFLTGNMVPNRLYLNKGNFEFEDISERAGVLGNKPWSTGVVMADVNADGLLDIYVSNAGNLEGNNHDNDLYINNGDLTFTERAEEFNLAKTGFTTHATFFDYDKDGDLDAYILNNSNIPVSSLGYAEQREVRAQDWEGVPHIFRGVGDMLLRNDGGKFVDVSEEAGIYGSLIGFGLGVMISDFNQDRYPDIYVSNDFYERDYLYINNGNGTFSEQIKEWTNHLSLSAMGIDIGDINNDGHQDIFITDMLPEPEERVKSVMEFEGYKVFDLKRGKDFYQQYIQNTLQLNNGNGTFSEIAYYSGVDATDWSWAGLLFDMDNDGLRDIFITNGINHDLTDLDFVDFFADEIIQKMALTGKKESIDSIITKMPIKPQPNYAYRNKGDLTFSKENSAWGFDTPTRSNGAAYGDLDNDGDLDLVINNVNMEAYLYRNNTQQMQGNSYLRMKFKGSKQNPFAIGTTVMGYKGSEIIVQDLVPSRGFQSSVDYTLVFGLGKARVLDSLRVIWPDEKTEILRNVAVNQELVFDQEQASDKYFPPKNSGATPYMSEISRKDLQAHEEDNYNDFDHEGLIYSKLSQEGPALATGDVNGDGHEDVFFGGGTDQSAILYFHQGEGKLRKQAVPAFEADASFEDTAAAFFDADGDQDLDLIVATGGNQVGKNRTYRPRLYLNDGRGNFQKSGTDLPTSFKNMSTVSPEDFDGDGDIDVFIGSRSVVGIYGVNPNHLLLENQGDGTFRDATERLANDMKDTGMVTAAVWTDLDGDGKNDLFVTTDWDSPKIYRNNGRKLAKWNTGLDSLRGWWNTVTAADLDGDGDQDLILGNDGSNMHYRPKPGSPMKMWVNDFDNNGTLEQIITVQENGRDYPIHMKKELTGQLVSLKKENLRASVYAKRTIQELLPQEVVANSIIKEVNISESVLLINEGGWKFRVQKLPERVQLSCICGIACMDVNNDGHLDLVMGGNKHEFKPQFSRLDAGYGNVLLGDGNLDFKWQQYDQSGFFVRGEVKYIKPIRDRNGKTYLVVALNEDQPRIFKLDE